MSGVLMFYAGVAVVNGAFHKGAKNTFAILDRATELPGVSVILGQEFKYVSASTGVEHPWQAIQDMESQAKAGSVVAFDTTVWTYVDHGLAFGTDGGRETLDRYILWVDLLHIESGRTIRFVAMHLPPKRAFRYWAPMLRAYLKLRASSPHRVVVGADWNKSGSAVARATRRIWRGVEVLGVSLPKHLAGRGVTAYDIGSDHPTPVAHIKLRPKRKRR